MNQSVWVLNGPNLNLLGSRDPAIYGTATLADVEELCRVEAAALDLEMVFVQSNHEGVLIDKIQEAFFAGASIICNFGALTHTSIAIMDALESVTAPVVEVHISDIHQREEFRRHSYVSLASDHVIIGHGVDGYAQAMRKVRELLDARQAGPA